ncbi:MAG TPA: hypothetical protein VGW75_02875 [Solirubrobacteraceae bacterium]|nr:hypothetical protein [Solirubrobacteraceae bacterium]
MAALLALAAVAVVRAAEPRPWDGSNPFACELQYAGFEPAGSDPAADPYCVEFDKRRQNVTQLGIVDFFAKEPERVASAGDKCFYYQVDHWRSAVVQDDGTTAVYEWDGAYFFDKARAEGGAHVTNFRVNGRTEDPGRVPGMPPEYAQHMGPGSGGVRFAHGDGPDPRCVEKARREPVYAAQGGGGGDGRGGASAGCRAPSVTSRRLGPVALGDSEATVRAKLGPPAEVRRGFLRYCADGAYLVGQRTDRSGDLGAGDAEPAVMIVARRGRFRHGPGTPAKRIRRLRPAGSVARTRVWLGRRGRVVYGTRGGRVRWVAVYDRRALRSRRAMRELLRRALVG